MITIVTSRTYLLCEGINSITLQFSPDHISNTRYIPYYDIYINFIPQSRGNNNNNKSSDESTVLTVRVAGEKVALATFKEIAAQLREQLPDQAYLDKILEDILSGGKDVYDEHSETEVLGVRKKKRRGEAVLRKTPTSRPRRKR